MSIKFKVSGPFPITYGVPSHGKGKYIDGSHAKTFWGGDQSEFAEKQGCYVFCLAVAKGHTPWYVGKTKNKLQDECFAADKINKYNSVIREKKGRPVLFFVTRMDGEKVVPKDILKELEKTLIQAGKMKNDSIVNNHHTNTIPSWSIAGVLRGGRGENSSLTETFRKAIGL